MSPYLYLFIFHVVVINMIVY